MTVATRIPPTYHLDERNWYGTGLVLSQHLENPESPSHDRRAILKKPTFPDFFVDGPRIYLVW